MTEAVLKSGRAFVLENVGHSPYAATHTAMLFPSQSIMALPLIAGSQKLGAAFIIFLAPHHFTPDEIQQGEQVVSHFPGPGQSPGAKSGKGTARTGRNTQQSDRRVGQQSGSQASVRGDFGAVGPGRRL